MSPLPNPPLRGKVREGVFAVLLALLLTACGGQGGWDKPGADPEALARDNRGCRAQAARVLARDRAIDQDILATRGPDWQRSGAAEPHHQQMHEQAAADAEAAFDGCMRAKGYARRG